jgi:hypothetical protein
LSPLSSSSSGMVPLMRSNNLASTQPLNSATDSTNNSQINPLDQMVPSRQGGGQPLARAIAQPQTKPQGKIVVTTKHPPNKTNRRIISPNEDDLKNNE